MVDRAQLQPDHVQENFLNFSKNGPTVVYSTPANVVNNQYSCRFVYNHSVSDLNILKQEMSATRATWRKWLAIILWHIFRFLLHETSPWLSGYLFDLYLTLFSPMAEACLNTPGD